MSTANVRTAKASDFTPDAQNANKGTERGLRMLDDSLREDGAGRSILVDANNKVIAGNKTLERAVDLGIEDVIVVETDGRQLVAVKRSDLDLGEAGGAARRLAYRDNRTGELDLAWDIEQIQADQAELPDLLASLWQPEEYAALIASLNPEPPDFQPVGEDEQGRLDEKAKVTCPECGHVFPAR